MTDVGHTRTALLATGAALLVGAALLAMRQRASRPDTGAGQAGAPPPRLAASPTGPATAASPADHRVTAARDRGAGCLGALPRVSPDALWALGEARPLAPRALDAAWSAHRPRLDPGSILRRLIDPGAPAVPPNPRAGNEPGDPAARLLAYLHDSLSCTGAPPSARLTAFVDEDHDGYVRTHQYFAVEWARRSGCEVPGAWPERQRALAAAVLDELAAAPTFDDLFAERLFVVAHAGQASSLRPDWIDTLLAHQGPDGCWRDPAPIEARLGDASFTASASIDHTTALALYVVARLAHDAR